MFCLIQLLGSYLAFGKGSCYSFLKCLHLRPWSDAYLLYPYLNIEVNLLLFHPFFSGIICLLI
jgi:hypothetical protein